jgi:hypothetical protein
MQIPLAFADQAVIEEVPLPLWRELFDELGWPASLRGRGESLTHDEITDAFQRDIPSDELLLAIEALHNLGTPEGKETISAMLADCQLPPGTLPQGLGERELALRLFIAQRSDDALAEVFSRAQVQIQEGNRRRFNDFIGKQPKVISNLSTQGKSLERSIRAHCEKEDCGDHVQLRTSNDNDGACNFRILRSHRLTKPLAVVPGSKARAMIEYRPVHADFVRYEPTIGRLRIIARAASIVEFYRKAFGKILFADETFFYGQPVCSLKILQESGRTALENHGVFGLGRVWMTGCIWDRSDRERLTFRAHDCFESFEKLGISLSEGELLEAKLKIEVIEKSARPVTVTVRPNQIEVSQIKHESLINEVLAGVGIRDASPRSSPNDLWALYPWRQPTNTWRECFFADTDSLVKKGILNKIQLRSIEAPSHPGAGRILSAEQISATEFLGVSQIPEIPSRSLSATDLDGLELNVPAFQNHLRELLNIKANPHPWSGEQWFVDLGTLNIYEHQFRLAYAVRQPPQTAAAQIRSYAPASSLVLLLPKAVTAPTGLMEILLDRVLPDRWRVVRDIIAAAKLEDQVPARLIAPPAARLVVDSRLGKIWYDETEITGLEPGTHPFQFLEIVAGIAPSVINKHNIAKQLSEGRKDGDQVVRAAKSKAIKLIETALAAKGLPFEDPFKSERGSFRLTVPAYTNSSQFGGQTKTDEARAS